MPTNPVHPNTTLERLLQAAPEHRLVLEQLGINPTRQAGRTLAEVCQFRGLEAATVAWLLRDLIQDFQQALAAGSNAPS